MNNNIDSLAFLSVLLEDAKKELAYCTANPDLPDQQKLVDNWTAQCTMLVKKIDEIKSAADPATLKDDIIAWIERIEAILAFLPAGIRDFFEKAIAIVKQILKSL